jgi:4-hydroxy-4-methyl-2-oxoglutarate aldolase
MASLDRLIDTLRTLPCATVYEAAGQLGDVAPSIRALVDGVRLVGPAFTLKTKPGDNLAVFHAIDACPAGSVLVIDGGGSDRVTIWGGTSTIAAKAKGIAGCVTNAAVRDIDEIREQRFPVYAPATSVRGTAKSHTGWMNVTLAIGDAVIRPGDLVLGDGDGLVILPAEKAEEITAAAVERRKLELAREDRLRKGESMKKVLGF